MKCTCADVGITHLPGCEYAATIDMAAPEEFKMDVFVGIDPGYSSGGVYRVDSDGHLLAIMATAALVEEHTHRKYQKLVEQIESLKALLPGQMLKLSVFDDEAMKTYVEALPGAKSNEAKITGNKSYGERDWRCRWAEIELGPCHLVVFGDRRME
jgi:hypothetical protein